MQTGVNRIMSAQLVCNVDDVPKEGVKAFAVDDGTRVLIANSGDEYFAYQAICPHQEVELEEGFYDGCTLTCHEHLWQWDIRTGEPQGLAEKGLENYTVQVQDGQIYVEV